MVHPNTELPAMKKSSAVRSRRAKKSALEVLGVEQFVHRAGRTGRMGQKGVKPV